MIVRNFYETPGQMVSLHDGDGMGKNVQLYGAQDFDTPLRFINYTELGPGCSIGEHPHGHDEEVYVILSGHGVMTVNGEALAVKPGDVLLNKPYWNHGLANDTADETLCILVFEAQALAAGV